MEDTNQTLGQRRVSAKFNPSEEDLVDVIKKKSAELIDLFESMKPVGNIGTSFGSEKIRALSTAQTKIETACMYGVKANFIK